MFCGSGVIFLSSGLRKLNYIKKQSRYRNYNAMKKLKLLLSTILLLSFSSIACQDIKIDELSDDKKFLLAVKNSDFVYFGTVIRLYQVPDTPASDKNFNGYVFQVDERIKGKTLTHMDMAQKPLCDDSDSWLTENWPTDLGQEFVVAVREKNENYELLSVYPVDKAMNILYDIYEAANKR